MNTAEQVSAFLARADAWLHPDELLEATPYPDSVQVRVFRPQWSIPVLTVSHTDTAITVQDAMLWQFCRRHLVAAGIAEHPTMPVVLEGHLAADATDGVTWLWRRAREVELLEARGAWDAACMSIYAVENPYIQHAAALLNCLLYDHARAPEHIEWFQQMVNATRR